MIALLLTALVVSAACGAESISLRNEPWAVSVAPGTMAVTVTPKDRAAFRLSVGQSGLGAVKDLVQDGAKVRWELPEKALFVSMELDGNDLRVSIGSTKVGEFAWPVMEQTGPWRALIWPRWEGCYIPLDDPKWTDYLVKYGEWNTLEGITMPFWGLDCGDYSLTCIITNPCNNRIVFSKTDGRLEARFTHEFTPNNAVKEYGFVIRLAGNPSPVEPARQFRKWLVENGKLVSMQEKMGKVPRARRLLGAPHVYLWGDGVSAKMLGQFEQAGFDRMMLCVEGVSSVSGHPEVAAQADKMGYLFGTYDSYHSMHSPSIRGTDATWDTAQFDQKLYDTGAIVRRDGTKMRGFKGLGCKLSPIAAWPYVQKRVGENMAKAPFNYYFLDCDAFGEVYDDYSPLHPTTQAGDIAARVKRLAWISETYRAVVGSEGGSSYSAPVIHVAEGMFGPSFGWGDPDLKDRKSRYYLGGYYPPGGPRVFVQQVLLKPEYEYLFYDPRFRLPLYETVFHDSVVSTSHWSCGSLKFTSVLDTVALTELLYQVSPLYHMNLDEFRKHREAMKKHFAFFSPIHRELGFSQMTDFAWLTPDRLVQRTVFGDKAEMVANFGERSFRYRGVSVPGRSILARWLKTGKTQLFTPGAKQG